MKKKLFIILPFVAVTLSGCSFIKKLIFGDDDVTTSKMVFPDPVVEEDVPGRSTYKSFSYNLKDVLHTTNQHPLNSVGTAKVLIVPVQLKSSSNVWHAEELTTINNCFFGDPETTGLGWESVSSYYNKSSYGKLTIQGSVASIFNSQYTFSQLDALEHPDRKIVQEFEQSSAYNSILKNYDTDEDGYIDSVAFIYREPIKIEGKTMKWWAFVYSGDSAPDVDKPTVNEYMWASFDFTKKATKDNPHGGKYDKDAHTYIHEFGHLLGLDDYYSYSDDNTYDPSGGQEMHSQNIGDENIYSKLCLGWIEPYYIKTTSSVTTTLNTSAFYANGNCIILNDNWNGTPMDEYIILEYYTPTVLNQQDSESAYAKNAQMFQTSGFRIYHVDSRLVAYRKYGEAGFEKRLDSIDPDYFNFIGASNTPAYPYSRLNNATEIKEYKLLHMMQAGGVNTFKQGVKATNEDLFKTGQSFKATSKFFFNGDKFNNGEKVGYRITIGTCGPTSGTVTITKI